VEDDALDINTWLGFSFAANKHSNADGAYTAESIKVEQPSHRRGVELLLRTVPFVNLLMNG